MYKAQKIKKRSIQRIILITCMIYIYKELSSIQIELTVLNQPPTKPYNCFRPELKEPVESIIRNSEK